MKFFTKVIFRKDPSFSACPACGEANKIRRSHSRNFKEKFINKVAIFKIYRCKNCGWRGLLPTFVLTPKSIITILSYILLAWGIAFIVLEILKRYYSD